MSQHLATRSFLFVPGDRPERFAKAAASGADAIIVDLEDAVGIADKETARAACRTWLQSGGTGCIRINALGTEWASEDLSLCGLSGVQGVVLSKAESKSDIAEVAGRLLPGVPVLPIIETANGMMNVKEIATAPGVLRLLFGTVDFCLDLAIEDDGDDLASYRSLLVLASRAAGLQAPVDGVTLDIGDAGRLAVATRRARRTGFGGKLCIHPSQVSAVNECFVPTAAEMEWANSVIERAASSSGVFMFEGRMIDAPVIERAQRLLRHMKPPLSSGGARVTSP
ncbi:HpcH/HpaI aldolase/citrate lyase family protein [Trinickia mobilis]|uniref:HpcH/HpaI aldolase/citrate lyase family protein n=1 Tax=Trinickia mobilis TaxID=2816356 RepID=UPI001A8BF47E|nr:CoA ester lyase [Trinickia mobilis]